MVRFSPLAEVVEYGYLNPKLPPPDHIQLAKFPKKRFSGTHMRVSNRISEQSIVSNRPSYDNGDFLADGILGMDEVHSRLDTGAFKVGKAFNRPLVNLHKRETGSVSRASNGKLAFDPRRKRLRCARRRGGPRPRCTA